MARNMRQVKFENAAHKLEISGHQLEYLAGKYVEWFADPNVATYTLNDLESAIRNLLMGTLNVLDELAAESSPE